MTCSSKKTHGKKIAQLTNKNYRNKGIRLEMSVQLFLNTILTIEPPVKIDKWDENYLKYFMYTQLYYIDFFIK